MPGNYDIADLDWKMTKCLFFFFLIQKLYVGSSGEQTLFVYIANSFLVSQQSQT